MICNLLEQPTFAHHRGGDEGGTWSNISIFFGAIAVHVVDKRFNHFFGKVVRINIERRERSFQVAELRVDRLLSAAVQ